MVAAAFICLGLCVVCLILVLIMHGLAKGPDALALLIPMLVLVGMCASSGFISVLLFVVAGVTGRI